MLKLIEIYHPTIDAKELVASVDVTENTEAERVAVLAALRDLYGAECSYYWHDCGHDEDRRCSQYPAD